tara:strand:- start:18 stop:446 length:429 start_codon:yes stop_codon:yes gene_type:complete
MIKTFRGQLADGDIETIRLSTNNGLTGYKIKKFQIMPATPAGATGAFVGQIYTIEPAAATASVDFNDGTMIAASIYITATATNDNFDTSVIVDNKIFNQDIFVGMVDGTASEACNYYIELEQVKLDLAEATVATLKDMRGAN